MKLSYCQNTRFVHRRWSAFVLHLFCLCFSFYLNRTDMVPLQSELFMKCSLGFNASGSAWLPDEGPTLQQQTIIKCKKIPSCCAFCRRLKVVVLARGTPGDGCYLCPKWPKYTFNLLVFVLPCPERRDLNGNHMVTGRTFICGNASNWFLFYANKRIDYRALLWFLQLVLFSAQSSFLLVWHWFIFHLKWPGMRIECTIEYFFARWLRLIYPMYHLPNQWP